MSNRTCTVLDWVGFSLILLVALVTLVGCAGQTRVTGGQQRQDSKALHVTITADGVTVDDSREHVATTQPSISSSAGQAVHTDTVGDLGGISLTAVKQGLKGSWPLAGILALIGVGLWYIKQPIAGAGCVAGAVLSILYPQALVFTAIATLVAVVYLIWTHSRQLREVVRGNELALDSLPPDAKDTAKLNMQAKQSVDTQRVVAAVKSGG